jgi:adenylosuccinate synthase
MIDPDLLLAEIDRFGPQASAALRIHENAAVVLPEDRAAEKEALVAIGSTRKGTAAAATRKMMRADVGLPRRASEHPVLSKWTITARDYDDIIASADIVQIESAQGIELSLSRGRFYPYCTGRDVTPEQILNDVGVPWRELEETCLVIRTYPIRVGDEYREGVKVGTSGPVYAGMQEMDWESVSAEVGKPVHEITTVTKKVRRVFRFSHGQFKHALCVAGPSSVFVNFANYLDPNAKSLDAANEKAKKFINSVDKTAGLLDSHVQWIGWGPNYEDIETLGVAR